MPIRPENRARYPADWPEISVEVRERAGGRCEGSPAYPDCRAENRQPHPVTGSKVVLTVAHLDHQPENVGTPGDRPNLKAWCQRCHLTYDAAYKAASAAARRWSEDHGDTIEVVSVGRGDCGCPEESYLFNSIDLTMHFEPNGDVDAFMDGGDWGEAETTEEGLTMAAGRRAIFAWARSLTTGPSL